VNDHENVSDHESAIESVLKNDRASENESGDAAAATGDDRDDLGNLCMMIEIPLVMSG
jgi:hypothetical protein